MYPQMSLMKHTEQKNISGLLLLIDLEKALDSLSWSFIQRALKFLNFGYSLRRRIRGSCKKFCHWVPITSVLRFIKHIFITNLQSIPPLLKHIFVTFLPSREKQINSLLLVSVGDTDK